MTQHASTLVKGESMNISVRNYREIQLKEKATLVISQELAAQIMYNHLSNPNVEWSGFLFYDVEEGSLENIKELKLRAQRLYLQDVGSAGYTSFEMTGEKIVDMATTVPDYETSKIGIIHTHHNMACFFSGTDKDELQENASAHIYYLSLIVNHKGPWCAKIAVPAIRKNNTVILRRDEETGEQKEFSETDLTADSESEDVLYLIDCNIQYELEPWYIENFEKVEEEKRKARVVTAGFQVGQGNGSTGNPNGPSVGGEPYRYMLVNDGSVRTILTIAFKNAVSEARGFDYEDYTKLAYPQRPLLWDIVKEFNLKINTPKPASKAKITSIINEFIGNLELIAEDVYAIGMLNNPDNLYKMYKECTTLMMTYKNSFSDVAVFDALVKALMEQRDLNQEISNSEVGNVIYVS